MRGSSISWARLCRRDVLLYVELAFGKDQAMPLFRRSLKFLIVMGVTFAPGYGNAAYGQGAAGMAGVKFAAEVPLLDCEGTPCVDARIGDSKVLRFGIDTGNVDSVIDSKIAEAAGLKPLEPPKPGAPSGMYRTAIRVVHVGELTLTEVPAIGM